MFDDHLFLSIKGNEPVDQEIKDRCLLAIITRPHVHMYTLLGGDITSVHLSRRLVDEGTIDSTRQSTRKAQTSLAKADHYPHIAAA